MAGDEGEQIVGVADMLAEQADGRRRLGGRLPGQLEITIRRDRSLGEADDAGCGVRTLDLHRMMMALHFAERKAGLQTHADVHRIDRRVLRWIEDRR